MILWLAVGCMTLAVLGTLLLAIFETRQPQARRADYNLQVFRDQLREVERDAERNLIAGAEVEAALTEIKRRMLLADREPAGRLKEGSRAMDKTTAASLTVLIPVVAVGLYALLGSPDQSSTPLAVRTDPLREHPASGAGGTGLDSVETMVGRLAGRLQEQPDDAEGWRMLGWSYLNLGRYQDAAEAYERAAALRPDSAELLSAFGEASVRAASGRVTAETVETFERAVALDPAEPRARFFLGLAKEQSGDKAAALEIWREIVATASPDAPWLSDLRLRSNALARELGLDPTEAPPVVAAASPVGGPSAQDMKEAAKLPSEERSEMIAGMVDRLAERLEESPRDHEGWIRLARSRQVQGRNEDARAALRRALDVFADDPAVQQEIHDAARQLAIAPGE